MRFKDKTVLITGAAGTIGSAVAKAFYDEGANLSLVDWNMEALEEVTAKMGFGDRALLLQADVTDEAQVFNYVKETINKYGTIDIFHNNAGITGSRVSITNIDYDYFKKLMSVNVSGIFLGLKHVLPQMYEQEGGVVINTASHKGRLAARNSADYAASKSAVIMLTKVAALEAAEFNVRVNAVMPGIVHSPMIVENRKRLSPGISEEQIERDIAGSLPLGRWCEPEEVANMIMFLASDEASYLTGTELRLDGGSTAAYY